MPDEFEIIEAMAKAAGTLPRGYSPLGDDVAVIPAKEGRLILKADMLVGKTDVPTGMSHRQAARKAVAMCVSDFAAKGVRPDSFMASIAVPRSITETQVRELALGFEDAAKEWALKFVGGDTNEGDDLIVDCVMAGFGKRLVTRGGARPGDLVVTTGVFGYPPAGLKLMSGEAEAPTAFRRRAVNSVVLPSPNLEVGLALADYLNASMDSSDGLAVSLYTLAETSGVGFTLDRLPTSPDVSRFAKANGLSSDELVLGGGEEYLIVGTLKPGALGAALRRARRAGGKLIRIGEVTGDQGSVLLRKGGSLRPVPRIGWRHLS